MGKTGVADENNPPILRRFPKDGGRQKKGNGELPSWNLSRGKALRLDLLQAVRSQKVPRCSAEGYHFTSGSLSSSLVRLRGLLPAH